jgi:RimJ/RimL family protein N-acetyltransferase
VKVAPVTLEGRTVRLEPVTSEHVDGLWHAGRFPEVWRMRPYPVSSAVEMREQVELAMGAADAGILLMFATVDKSSGRVIGTTSFLNIDMPNRRLEIGATWITPAGQRSPANTEAKLVQLTHCFEDLGCLRVEFKTDARNERSRGALEALGAKFEGILRKHMVVQGGAARDSAYYSVIDDEWSEVQAGLRARLS